MTPNDHYRGRTAPLNSNVAFYIFIQQIQVLNILNMVYSFSSKRSLFHNSNVFGSCIIHFYIQGVLQLKKKNSGAKRLNMVYTLRFFSSKCSFFHNSNVSGSWLFTFYIQGVLKLKKNNSGAKRLNMVYTIRFVSSKCSLFHNSNVFGSCIIHILYTECAKIKEIIPAPKG